jgi:hypothetical protein
VSVRIWVNRSWATTVHSLRLIRSNPDAEPVFLLGTHADPDSPVLTECDERAPELEAEGDAYVDAALELCARQRIDVFVPRWEGLAVARRVEEFRALGTEVTCSPAGAVETLQDKDLTYLTSQQAGFPVPPWRVARTAAELAEAHAELGADGDSVCVKPLVGVGAGGYRLLDDAPLTLDELAGLPTPRIPLARVLEALRLAESSGQPVPALMVMPYLSGPEVSVDTLTGPGGEVLGSMVRTQRGRRRMLVRDQGSQALARDLAEHYGLVHLSNVQLRWWRGELTLLEINTRAAGGVHQAALAGWNLPWASIRLALGRAVDLPEPVLPVAYTAVDDVVRLGG